MSQILISSTFVVVCFLVGFMIEFLKQKINANIKEEVMNTESPEIIQLREDRVDFYDNCVKWDLLPKYVRYRMDKHKNRLCTRNLKSIRFEEFKERLEIDIDYEVVKYNSMVEFVVKYLKDCITLGKYTRQLDEIHELAKEILNKMDFNILDILDISYSEIDGLYIRNSYEVEHVAKELGYVTSLYFH